MSLAGVRLLARRCPACRWREPGLRRPSGTGEGAPGYCLLWRATGESCLRALAWRWRQSTRCRGRWRTGS